ncbi:hypothetical protein G1C95_0312 [Bifidobacterium sp. DSM 109957]|uniref:PPM-type phosphatase domain-containing protein n=1 Tax=Bifidobacterium oedipodis TaxID=2675322 RepID=A0A7Y0EMY8_9BIFI|nr:hypothetical protein [Bifidobacterium sp. DSM 109957]
MGKHGDPSLNEDGLFIGSAYVAVIDGVTSKAEYDLWHPSPGVVAKDTLLAALRDCDAKDAATPAADMTGMAPTVEYSGSSGYDDRNDGDNGNKHDDFPNGPDSTNALIPFDMRGMQHALDSALLAQYSCNSSQSAEFFATHPVERLQANAVVYSAPRHEIWLFGDCQAIVNGMQIPTVKRVDMLLADLRSFVAQADPTADSRAAILPFLRVQSRFANHPGEFGYFVFDGYTDPNWPIRIIPVKPGDEVILASDGYPHLLPTLAESETALQEIRRTDSQLIGEYRSTKGFLPGSDAFDDRTYIRFIA